MGYPYRLLNSRDVYKCISGWRKLSKNTLINYYKFDVSRNVLTFTKILKSVGFIELLNI